MSSPDKIDSQVKDGVDFFPNDEATGFTPKTNLESLYHKANSAYTATKFKPASDGIKAEQKVQPQFTSPFMDTPIAGHTAGGGELWSTKYPKTPSTTWGNEDGTMATPDSGEGVISGFPPKYYATLSPIKDRVSIWRSESGGYTFNLGGTVPPNDVNMQKPYKRYPYPGKFTDMGTHITLYGIPDLKGGNFSITKQPAGNSYNSPSYPGAHGSSLLPAPNLFDFQAFRARSRSAETSPFHSSLNAPFTTVTLPNIFSPSGYDVEFGLDGDVNLRNRYKDGSIHIESGDNKSPVGGAVTQFATLRPIVDRTSQFSTPEEIGGDNEYTTPPGLSLGNFQGVQSTFNLRKENFRIGTGETNIDNFQSEFSVTTLKKSYGDSDYVKDLFKYTTKGSNTFKNVPNGIDKNGNQTTEDYRAVANKGPFEGNDNHPLILRGVGNNWGIDSLSAENPLGDMAGGFVRGAPGITGYISRTFTDKIRLAKFMFTTSEGLGFTLKQFALQALNPTLESKIYNPLSTLSITGASSLISAFQPDGLSNPAALARTLGSSLASVFFQIGHPERHLGGKRYEDVVVTELTPKGRLAQQGLAFSASDVVGEAPKLKSGIKFLDNYVNNKVDKVMGDAEAAQYVPKFVLGNPNRYGFPISSAPKSIENGVPSFTGTADLALTDVNNAMTKAGGTFNKATSDVNETTKHGVLTRHSTLSYSQLNQKFSYFNESADAPIGMRERIDSRRENNTTNLFLESKRGEGADIVYRTGNSSNGTGAAPEIGGNNGKLGETLGVIKGNTTSENVDRINILPVLHGETLPKLITDNKDFIKFRFKDVVNNKYLVFRAILSGITDTITPEFNPIKYIGRPDNLYTYTGVDREISFTFKIYPKTKQELPVLMEKMNYLVGLCYPSFTEGERMITPFIELTMGDMFVDAPGLLSSLAVTVEDETTWETDSGLQFPHYISAQCSFKYIGKHIPVSTGKHYDLDWLDGDLRDGSKPLGSYKKTTGAPSRNKHDYINVAAGLATE